MKQTLTLKVTFCTRPRKHLPLFPIWWGDYCRMGEGARCIKWPCGSTGHTNTLQWRCFNHTAALEGIHQYTHSDTYTLGHDNTFTTQWQKRAAGKVLRMNFDSLSFRGKQKLHSKYLQIVCFSLNILKYPIQLFVYDLDTSTVVRLGVLRELDPPAPVWQPWDCSQLKAQDLPGSNLWKFPVVSW